MSKENNSARSLGRILVVDDEPEPLRAHVRVLRHEGYDVVTADTGTAALEAIRQGGFDVILSDIFLPGMNGIELLRLAHEQDADVPVVLITGAPAIETAVQALDHGAYKYLLKPVGADRLVEVIHKAAQMARMAQIRREAMKVAHGSHGPELREAFGRALESLWIAFQPIVTREGKLYGHEALMRIREPSIPHPGAMLDAAERLDQLTQLGRLIRRRAAEPVSTNPDCGSLFVNVHPYDLADDDMVDPRADLTQLAGRVVLEVTERHSVGNVQDLRNRIARLRELGFRIAVDDLGAGYAGLTSFALLEPDIVKVDMSLVRDIDKMPVKQRLVRSVTSLCADMNIVVVGEGVETREERDTLVELGCDLMQGYLLAKPAAPFPAFQW